MVVVLLVVVVVGAAVVDVVDNVVVVVGAAVVVVVLPISVVVVDASVVELVDDVVVVGAAVVVVVLLLVVVVGACVVELVDDVVVVVGTAVVVVVPSVRSWIGSMQLSISFPRSVMGPLHAPLLSAFSKKTLKRASAAARQAVRPNEPPVAVTFDPKQASRRAAFLAAAFSLSAWHSPGSGTLAAIRAAHTSKAFAMVVASPGQGPLPSALANARMNLLLVL